MKYFFVLHSVWLFCAFPNMLGRADNVLKISLTVLSNLFPFSPFFPCLRSPGRADVVQLISDGLYCLCVSSSICKSSHLTDHSVQNTKIKIEI